MIIEVNQANKNSLLKAESEGEPRPVLLDQDEDFGSISGYMTFPKSQSQLENYLEEQGIYGFFSEFKNQFNTVAILKSMWVEEEERGNGIGAKLLDSFIENAQDNQAEAILLVADTSAENQFDLINWYENKGFSIAYGNRESFPVMIMDLTE